MLYCIENAVGAPAPDGQFAAYKEEVVEHARRAFRVSPEVHARALRAAGSERPPTVVLGCSVIEADGLEAKDANGKHLLWIVNHNSFIHHKLGWEPEQN